MWKLIENPKEGEPVVFLGVHALRWRPEWGEPKIAFVDIDDDEEICEVRGMLMTLLAAYDANSQIHLASVISNIRKYLYSDR